MDQPKPKRKQLQIELDEKVGSGEYANLAIVTHSPAEFIMDFTQVLPGMPKARVRSRIIMAPLHAKAFVKALQGNIAKYESRFGEIKTTPDEWMNELGIKIDPDSMPN